MVDPIEFRRRIRRRIQRDGMKADIAADVNVVVSTGGGGAATARQVTSIRQGRSARTSPDGPDQKEKP